MKGDIQHINEAAKWGQKAEKAEEQMRVLGELLAQARWDHHKAMRERHKALGKIGKKPETLAP